MTMFDSRTASGFNPQVEQQAVRGHVRAGRNAEERGRGGVWGVVVRIVSVMLQKTASGVPWALDCKWINYLTLIRPTGSLGKDWTAVHGTNHRLQFYIQTTASSDAVTVG